MFLISVMLLSNILLVLATKSEKHNDDSHQHLNALLRIKKQAKNEDFSGKKKIWDHYVNSQIDRSHKNRRKFVYRMFNQRDPIEEQVEHLTEKGKIMYAHKDEAGRIVGRFMFDRAKEHRNQSQKIQREMLDLKNDPKQA